VIFPDRTLNELAVSRPATQAQMLDVSGVGEVKRERYGEDFLNEIRQFESGA